MDWPRSTINEWVENVETVAAIAWTTTAGGVPEPPEASQAWAATCSVARRSHRSTALVHRPELGGEQRVGGAADLPDRATRGQMRAMGVFDHAHEPLVDPFTGVRGGSHRLLVASEALVERRAHQRIAVSRNGGTASGD